MARLSTARAASRTASDRVGWACQMREIFSALPANSITVTASAIRSEARGPEMWTPSTRPVRASATPLTPPTLVPYARAGLLLATGGGVRLPANGHAPLVSPEEHVLALAARVDDDLAALGRRPGHLGVAVQGEPLLGE